MKFANSIIVIGLFAIPSFAQTQLGNDINGEAAKDNSGFSVSISGDGSIVAIGATGNDGNGNESGHVRVYKYEVDNWSQLGSDIDGEASNDNSGFAVSLSNDGSILAVGAIYNSGNGAASGHVRIYKYTTGVWTQLGADIDGEASMDVSGYSVSISSDGSIVAIGAPFNNGNGTFAGHVRVFKYTSGAWPQLGADIDGEAAGDYCGMSVSISGDGSFVAIGAPFNSENETNAGHVRIFKYTSGVWSQLGADIDGEAADDYCGYSKSVSLSSDGSTVAIGSPFNSTYGPSAGKARVFKYTAGAWSQIGEDIKGVAATDLCGFSLSISQDGNKLAIGSPGNDKNGTNSGLAAVYQFVSGSWNKLEADIKGEASDDQFGEVSLSKDGKTLAIGSEYNDGNGSDAGHVKVFSLSELSKLQPDIIYPKFCVYPNPTINQLIIKSNASKINSLYTIYNLVGTEVKTGKIVSETTIIDLEDMLAGSYLLKLSGPNILSYRIIKL